MTGYKSVPSVAAGVAFIRPEVFRQITDFGNIFKSFIGTNWIGLPFAFKQSGLLLGCVALLLIVIVTDHCSQLIIKCKKAAVKTVLLTNTRYNDPTTSEQELQEIRENTEKRIMYSDIGRMALGKTGIVLVEISLLGTQFCFCIGYLIFIGNTLMSMFTEVAKPAHLNVTSPNTTHGPEQVSRAPSFPILVLIPVVPLILMSFIRRVRKLGPVSVLSNISLLVAFLSVLCYMLSGLHFRTQDIKLANWATFPIFFGQVTSAYEGMGTLVPIETSMGENRHRYPLYLHFAIGSVSCILCGFGVIGYFVYGDQTPQIVTQMLPPGPLVFIVKVLLCLAILFTYPLQLFPITEVIESYIFKPKEMVREEVITDPEAQQSVNRELANSASMQQDSIMTDVGCSPDVDETTELLSATGNTLKRPKKKVNWRKNFLRTIIVIITGGMAILLKDDFAYVSALCGSIGSSTLGYMLPCIFHNVLNKGINSKWVILKNYLIIMFGAVGGGVGLTVTIMEIVKTFK